MDSRKSIWSTNASKAPLTNQAIEEDATEGAVRRLRPKLMTVTAVLASLVPILWESGVGSDVTNTHRRAYRGRHDYLDHSRSDSGFQCSS
jgi:hypothetical protein